jgi:glycyl-tRNA synthetase
MEKLVALCKRRGFIYPGSEIYGGLAGTWDWGPMGVELKRNIKNLWWRQMVQLRTDIVGIDAAIMMNPRAWEASGHVESFTDPLVECKICHKRFRSDKPEEITAHEGSHKGKTPAWTEPQKFNLLVKSYLGIIEGKESEIFLRGEITNGAHVNFKNIVDSSRVRIPFGIAQIGKAFRNEITPGNFVFRSREFEQMEVQFYIEPTEEEGKKWFEYWKENRMKWFIDLGMNKNKLRFRDHAPDEIAHYARAATDIEYESPLGFQEMMGIHNRGDWDLSRHQQYSSKKLTYRDPISNAEYLPWDIETSMGIERPLLFLLLDAYHEENGRVVLKLDPRLAPYKVAVFPLLANKPELVDMARKIHHNVQKDYMAAWDERGNIGKRYAAQDEVGTPFCITVDFQSLEDQTVTIRHRDSGKQERIGVDAISPYLLSILHK